MNSYKKEVTIMFSTCLVVVGLCFAPVAYGEPNIPDAGSGAGIVFDDGVDDSSDVVVTAPTPVAVATTEPTPVSTTVKNTTQPVTKAQESAAPEPVVDTTAPQAPEIDVPESHVTINGTSEAHSTVYVYDALGTQIGETNADESGKFSIDIATDYLTNELSLKAQDDAGNVSDVTKYELVGNGAQAPEVTISTPNISVAIVTPEVEAATPSKTKSGFNMFSFFWGAVAVGVVAALILLIDKLRTKTAPEDADSTMIFEAVGENEENIVSQENIEQSNESASVTNVISDSTVQDIPNTVVAKEEEILDVPEVEPEIKMVEPVPLPEIDMADEPEEESVPESEEVSEDKKMSPDETLSLNGVRDAIKNNRYKGLS